jgi:hypothetical protein
VYSEGIEVHCLISMYILRKYMIKRQTGELPIQNKKLPPPGVLNWM